MMDPTKGRCMHGMCYECVTSADCTPPNTCDRPPDGDGVCQTDADQASPAQQKYAMPHTNRPNL